MSKRIGFAIVIAVVLLYAGLASVGADVRERAETLSGVSLADATIPVVQTGNLRVSLHQGPQPLCPGFNLYTTLVMTNTSETDSLTGLVVTDTAPGGTWVHEPDLAGPIPYTYDEGTDTITWDMGDLAPQDVIEVSYNLRTFSSLATGDTITHTLRYSAAELTSGGFISGTVDIDTSVCDPTPTPTNTPTNTPTPTLTPTPTWPKGQVHLPAVFR